MCAQSRSLQPHQAPLPMAFSRQEYWSGAPFPPPRDLPQPVVEPSPPALTGGSLTTAATWEAQGLVRMWGVWNICHSWWGCKMLQPLWKPVWQFFERLNMELPWDPEIPLLGVHLREMKTYSTQKFVNKCP